MLLVFKIKGIFEKKIPTQKYAERDSFYYIKYRYIYITIRYCFGIAFLRVTNTF